ncbi:MAG TPA: hypothetical protein VF796_05365 [Humisphaera sp.]
MATNTLQSWLSQGEQLYSAALAEFHALEAQLDELEQKLAAKQAEVNQIAQIINKPPVEQRRHNGVIQAEVMDEPTPAAHRLPIPAAMATPQTNSANATIARALTGKFGR